MDFFQVDILTPSKVVLRDMNADSVIIPTLKGEMNVLPEHTHVVSKLDIGVLSLKSASGSKHFVLEGGVCKVLNKKITIMASSCEEAKDVNFEKAKEERTQALQKMAGKETLSDMEFEAAQRKFRLSEARLRVHHS